METARSPNQVLREAVAAVGSQSAFGRLIGVTQQAVFKWLRDCKPLPAEHVLKAEAATGISRHDLRPDLYPRDLDRPAEPAMDPVR
jgi:DNA-binding transcriptional regulator YdaS (Cro superfamily)